MDRIRNNRLKPALLLLAVLLLRATIPVGFMPAAAGSGLLVVFCPDGASPEFMQFLSGGDDSDHDHMDHGDSGDTHQCSIGHMLLSAAATDDGAQPEDLAIAPSPGTSAAYFFASVSRTHYHSRGPPA